jgi:hypothetical protein
MAYKKPPNLNTKYGRRKWRQEAREYHDNLPPDEKARSEFWGCVILVIILIAVGGLILLISGPEALIKWLSH